MTGPLRKWAAGTTPPSSTTLKFWRRSLHLNGRKRDAGVPPAWTRQAKGAGVADLAGHPPLMHQCQAPKIGAPRRQLGLAIWEKPAGRLLNQVASHLPPGHFAQQRLFGRAAALRHRAAFVESAA